MEPCAERDKLKSAAAEALKDIISFTDRLLKAVGSDGPCSRRWIRIWRMLSEARKGRSEH